MQIERNCGRRWKRETSGRSEHGGSGERESGRSDGVKAGRGRWREVEKEKEAYVHSTA